jgi:hypothetical protein
VDDVGTLAPAVLERDPMVAGSEGSPRRNRAEHHERKRKDRGLQTSRSNQMSARRLSL